MPSRDPFEMTIETFSMVSVMTVSFRSTRSWCRRSDAAAWLGNAGDLGCDLGRALGEQLVQLLDGHARRLAERANGWAVAGGEVLIAHEPDDLPMRVGDVLDSLAVGEFGNHVFGPLLWVDEEPLVVEFDFDCSNRGHRYASLVSRLGDARLAGARHRRVDSWDFATRQEAVPVEPLEHQLAEVVEPRLFEQRQADGAGVMTRHGLLVVVEVDEHRLAEARLDEAVGVSVETGFEFLAGEEVPHVLDQRLALEVRHRACLRCGDVRGITDDEHVRARR